MRKGKFCEFEGTTEGSLNEYFFKSVMELDHKDWRISYIRAEYIYENKIDDKGKSYIKIAKEYIDEAIQMLSINKDTELDSVIDDPFILCNLLKIKEYKVYQLAGQIYAMYASNMEQSKFEDKALDYYKKYQIMLQRYKNNMTLENKSEIAVYSFRKYSIHTLEDLINNTITVIKPSKMNDPFDSIANLWRKRENLEKITNGKGHESILEKSMEYFRIRSFQANTATYNTDDSILQNVKMWSNYADNHYGFCIKYRLNKKFFREVNETAEITYRIAPIQYVPYYVIDSNKKTLNTFDAYFIKNKDWKEEGEVRLLSYNPKIEDDHWGVPMGNDAKIEEVIFGYLCTDDCKKTIYNLLSPKGVSFYMMKPTPKIDIYHLVKEEYHPHPKEK